jgi:hypothetical protein
MPNKNGKSTNKEEKFFKNLGQGAYSARWSGSGKNFKGKVSSIPGTNKGQSWLTTASTKDLKAAVARDRDSQRIAKKQGELDGMSASFYKQRADEYATALKIRQKKVAAVQKVKQNAAKKATPKSKKK